VTTLILVRHGETDWNRERRIQGATDIPLNDTGRAQARAAVENITELLRGAAPIIVASDLSRARETAELIAAGLGTRVARLYPGLRERSYGEAEGIDSTEFLARFGAWHAVDIPGAEPAHELRRRAVRTVRAVVRDARREPERSAAPVIAVTHGGLIREVIRHASAEEFPREGERIGNGEAYPFLVERERLRMMTAVAVC
jgi:probable phosphoglycerate mutase